MKTPSHGGPRPGAGRPLLKGEGSTITSVSLTAAQRAKLALLGGSAWVRAKIDAAKLKKPGNIS